MTSTLRVATSIAIVCVTFLSLATNVLAQSPSVIYTWDNTGNAVPNIENWIKNFGTNSAIFSNSIAGELTITETGGAGADLAISDGANRVRESPIQAQGGLDLTGLDYLEFDLGHNGSGNIDVQFFVQASTGFTFRSIGFLSVPPGVNTYKRPLSGLTPAEAVYVRTIGFKAFDHAAVGDVVWTLREVRSSGQPLQMRDLITHNNGTPEGGLQGAFVNFDQAAVQGNNGGQNQTGLSHNPAGSGSLQWTDLGGSQGAAISWGNGTAWNGNTFNHRLTDLSNYKHVVVRISATDPNNGGGELGFNTFFQTNNFTQHQQPEGGAGKYIPIDGEFHKFRWSLAGLTNMNVVDDTGINLFSHSQNLVINVDLIRFVPEPSGLALIAIGALGALNFTRRRP
jgi:hypothetical protein